MRHAAVIRGFGGFGGSHRWTGRGGRCNEVVVGMFLFLTFGALVANPRYSSISVISTIVCTRGPALTNDDYVSTFLLCCVSLSWQQLLVAASYI